MTDSADVLTNTCTAFYTKFTAVDGTGANNAFYQAINGQLFEDEAPEGTQYPYAVYSVVAAPKERVFQKVYTNPLIQLSIYSSNMDSSEIKDIYAHASALYDECSLTVTGSTFIMMQEVNLTTLIEEVDATLTGVSKVRAYHVDFDVLTVLS